MCGMSSSSRTLEGQGLRLAPILFCYWIARQPATHYRARSSLLPPLCCRAGPDPGLKAQRAGDAERALIPAGWLGAAIAGLADTYLHYGQATRTERNCSDR